MTTVQAEKTVRTMSPDEDGPIGPIVGRCAVIDTQVVRK